MDFFHLQFCSQSSRWAVCGGASKWLKRSWYWILSVSNRCTCKLKQWHKEDWIKHEKSHHNQSVYMSDTSECIAPFTPPIWCGPVVSQLCHFLNHRLFLTVQRHRHRKDLVLPIISLTCITALKKQVFPRLFMPLTGTKVLLTAGLLPLGRSV